MSSYCRVIVVTSLAAVPPKLLVSAVGRAHGRYVSIPWNENDDSNEGIQSITACDDILLICVIVVHGKGAGDMYE